MFEVQQVLNRLTAIALGSKNRRINLTGINSDYIAQLREQAYLDPIKDELTPKALLRYFEKCPVLDCPSDVQQWVKRLCPVPPVWRSPVKAVRKALGGYGGLAYCDENTIFVSQNESSDTFYHELAHLLFLRIPHELVKRLDDEARNHFSVRTHREIPDALDPKKSKPVRVPAGKYMLINRKYCGLDHSGTSNDAQRNEIWAHLFSEYRAGLTRSGYGVPERIQSIIEEIIMALEISARDPLGALE